MKPMLTVVSILTLTAIAWAAKPGTNPTFPKNLAAPTYRAPATQVAMPEFTKKDARRLAAIAESAADHLKLAAFYRSQAEALDAKGAAYEAAAAAFRSSPLTKNTAAPTTAGRWEFAAKGFRADAASNRVEAATHAAMAVNARVSE